MEQSSAAKKKRQRTGRRLSLRNALQDLCNHGYTTRDGWDDPDYFYREAKRLSELVNNFRELVAEAELPIPQAFYENAELHFPLRRFAEELADQRGVRETLVDTLFATEELLPKKQRSVYIGNGTTMFLLASRLLANIDSYPYDMSTHSLEILGKVYYGSKLCHMQNDRSFSFMGRDVDWKEGTLGEIMANSPQYDTVYISAKTLRVGPKKCQFITRDTASRAFAQEAIRNAYSSVVVLLERSKIDGYITGQDGGDIKLFDCLRDTSVSVYVVTDGVVKNAEHRKVLAESKITLIEPQDSSVRPLQRVDSNHGR